MMVPKRRKSEKSASEKSKTNTVQEEFDADIPDIAHNALLDSVTHVHGKNKITPATRSELAAEASEFNFTARKKVKKGQSEFREDDLIKAIKKKQPKVSQKLETVKKNKALAKPLASIHEKKVHREVGLNEVKSQLNRWDDIVMNNRVADQLQFPLKNKTIEIYNCTDTDIFSFSEPTLLELEFSKVLNHSRVSKEDKEKIEKSKFRLTLKEMIEKRKMVAKAKAQASYQVAKVKRQNKIKSKKYHRILRREKTQQQLKDFESLQKTDPEGAMRLLEQLEKNRAEERATLRHRNTGKWARNQIVKAKYNKESRIAISEQLSKNRELTQKTQQNSDIDSANSDVEENSVERNADPNNPWLSNTDEYSQFVSSYKKYWEETQCKSENQANRNVDPSTKENYDTIEDSPYTSEMKTNALEKEEIQPLFQSIPANKQVKKNKPKNKKKDRRKKISSVVTKSGTWLVTDISNLDHENSNVNRNIDELFDSLEKELDRKIKHRLKIVNEPLECNSHDVSQARKKTLEEPPGKVLNTAESSKVTVLSKNILSSSTSTQQKIKYVEMASSSAPVENIDPNKFLYVQPKRLATRISDVMDGSDEEIDDTEEENETNLKYQMTIGEAFADDDVVAEFQEEKIKAEEHSHPQIIDNSLPGWGSWTNAKKLHRNKEVRRNRLKVANKRLLFRVPKAPPQKDSNKGHVIINEKKSDKLKEHMVNELPYPFTKVEDFEANIRAPIGRTWIPETAHQQLIAPAVVTKLGTVIEPIDEKELIDRDAS